MSRLETARAELESAREENQRLEAENASLQERVSTAGSEAERRSEALAEVETQRDGLAEECGKLKTLYEGVLAEMQQEQEKAAGESSELHEEIASLRSAQEKAERDAAGWERVASELRTGMESAQEHKELEILRAVAEEKARWEAREHRLIVLLEQLPKQWGETFPSRHLSQPPQITGTVPTTVSFAPAPLLNTTLEPNIHTFDPRTADEPVGVGCGGEGGEERGWQGSSGLGGGGSLGCGDGGGGGGNTTVGSEGAVAERRSTSSEGLPMHVTSLPTSHLPMVAQQLPPLSKFTGEGTEGGETIVEWLEQLELVASACHWDESTKLVNLVTRLKGQAFSFYRSCDTQKRNQYATLVEELKKRFTPVHIQVVQSSLFHDRKQKSGEAVDSYAQDLKCLFYKAYPLAQQASSAMQDMGKSVLTNQFVAGLQPELKCKLAGKEGAFEQLLTLARFEEAKNRELRESRQNTGAPATPKKNGAQPSKTPAKGGENPRAQDAPASPNFRCYECGVRGHRARDCPDRRRRDKETPSANAGRDTRKKPTSAAITPDTQPDTQQGSRPVDDRRLEELRQQLREVEVELALQKKSATMRGVTCDEANPGTVQLGTAVHVELEFEGCRVNALIDTGSPATIVSLDCLLNSLARGRSKDQTPTEWELEVKRRLKPPEITLRSYGGGGLDIVGQIQATLQCGSYRQTAVVLVQNGAPEDLLLGTDLQPQLGFRLSQARPDGPAIQLLPAPDDVSLETEGGMRTAPVVRLLQSERLPARHGHIVRARVDTQISHAKQLFIPLGDSQLGQDWEAEEGLVEVGDDHTTTLILRNPTDITIHLAEGAVLGELQPAQEITNSEESSAVVGKVLVGENDRDCNRSNRIEELWQALTVEECGLTSLEVAQLRQTVEDFDDVFALHEFELGTTNTCQHSIDTGDSQPIRQLPRRVPFALRGQVDKMVEEMLERGVIEPSKSPWASPVVLVSKKDGSLRFCVDYRKLNAITKLDVFPLPRIDDSLDALAHTQYFTTLDLASGYWQVPMEPQSQEKTAFCTPSGLYEFRVMPFGLCNAPATFQRLMESVLGGLARNSCMVYLDDILVIGKSFSEHLQNLRQVLVRLREAGLCLKPKKCCLAKRQVEYLGYIVTTEGIVPDPKKVAAVRDFMVPKDLKTLRSFLGLASYYRRFISSFSKIAAPLFELTRKDTPYEWSPECQTAFSSLKHALTEAPVLAYPRFDDGFLLETDASGAGLGAVLAQKQQDETVRPIAYASRTLQQHERNYGVTELEALGVVWAVRHFRHYIYGHRCDVFTDHEALKALLNTPHPSGKLARWGLSLQELDLHIHYRPGRKNGNADALSRCPAEVPDQSKDVPKPVAALQPEVVPAKGGDRSLSKRQEEDPTLASVRSYLQDGTLPEDERAARHLILEQSSFSLVDNVLYRIVQDGSLRLVPPTEDRYLLFEEAHAGRFGGHLREHKIYTQLCRHYWWKGMRGDIADWCRACQVCASRRVGQAIRPPLVPLPVAGAFDRVGVDVIQFVRSNSGNQYVVVFIDYLTKWVEAFPTKDQTALTIAQLLVEEVISRHGVPRELLSDRGAAFLSALLKDICQLMGLKKVNTTAYHPQGDGLVERFNRTLTDMLAKTVDQSGKNWDTCLPYVLFAYRTSLQESTQESPFHLLYGRDPCLPTESALSVPATRQQFEVGSYLEELVTNLQEAWELARQNVKRAQRKQQRNYNRKTKIAPFRVGDRVFLHVPSAKRGKAHKFARPFKGPYRILTLYSNGADIRLVDSPQDQPKRVSLNRLRKCPKQIAGGRDDSVDPSSTEAEDNTAEEGDPDEGMANEDNALLPNSVLEVEGVQPGTEDKSDMVAVDSGDHGGVWAGRLRRHSKSQDTRGRGP